MFENIRDMCLNINYLNLEKFKNSQSDLTNSFLVGKPL